MDAEFRQRLDEAREAWPHFVGWIDANEALIEGFDPDRWHYPDWERRASPEAVEAHFGRSMPEDYYRFLRALSFAQAWAQELGVAGELLIHPEVPGQGRELRRHGPPELYPFAWMGVAGISYNFVFDGPDYVVAYFQPVDDPPVPWCYPSVAVFARCLALHGLGSARLNPRALRPSPPSPPARPEDYVGIFLEAAVLTRAFNLTFPNSDGYDLADEATALVRKQVEGGRYSVLAALFEEES
jgi:hypothetical protein